MFWGTRIRFSRTAMSDEEIAPSQKTGNIDRMTTYAQPGGSVQGGEVIDACDEAGIAMTFTDERCFHHF